SVLPSPLASDESSADRFRCSKRGKQPGFVRFYDQRTLWMCGIIGYVGPRACKPLLLQGLERLEYRGYDSAGLALLEDGGLDYVRAVGNLKMLKVAAGANDSQCTTGLGHTRWATHGRVSEENAHPLTGCEAHELAIVLNGIVENYRELMVPLLAAG